VAHAPVAAVEAALVYGQVPEDKDRHHLRSRREVADYLGGLSEAVASGNLGLPHR
jgi:hypothetical protein